MAETSIQPGDEVRYKNFPDRMTVEHIDGDKAYCRRVTSGMFDGYIRRSYFPVADLSHLLPRPTSCVDLMNLGPATVVRDGRIADQVDMLVHSQEGVQKVGGSPRHAVYCVWEDGGMGFGYWFDYRDLVYADG